MGAAPSAVAPSALSDSASDRPFPIPMVPECNRQERVAMRILVIDDEPKDAAIPGKGLSEAGFQVSTTSTAVTDWPRRAGASMTSSCSMPACPHAMAGR